jgi:tRNA threonylcarbamoyladenosine biosynthesis protein TsaE
MNNLTLKSPIILKTEQDMAHFATSLIPSIKKGAIIFLQGPLGAGKTTFVRGFLRGLGYSGIVKSPTYTLVETYPFDHTPTIHHFDLYRLKSPFELDHLGMDHYFNDQTISFIEWPEKAINILPQPSFSLIFKIQAHQRLISCQ